MTLNQIFKHKITTTLIPLIWSISGLVSSLLFKSPVVSFLIASIGVVSFCILNRNTNNPVRSYYSDI